MTQKTTPNNALRRERELRGWSQGYVAEQIEAPSPSYISRWERGATTPTPYYREKLCRLFDKNAQELGLVQVQEETTYEMPLADPEPIPPTHPPLSWHIRHRWVLLGALLLIVPVLLAVSFWPHPPPTRTWPRLQRDPNVHKQTVEIMQYMLKSHEYNIGTFGVERDGIDGFYGDQTDIAIRALKKAHHLSENDGVDDSTWEQLIKPSEKGNSGNQVKALQVQLNYLIKSELLLNGQFDSATENVVRRFQQMNHLPVTGRADLDVWCLLVGGDMSQKGGIKSAYLPLLLSE